jgi:hypothetical protein
MYTKNRVGIVKEKEKKKNVVYSTVPILLQVTCHYVIFSRYLFSTFFLIETYHDSFLLVTCAP